jgi:tRNA pseudouridine38-40 synthase
VAYHGAAFRGFVINEGINSVEGLLTDAISTVARHRVHIDVAGRTDAGVHARGQVITVDIPAETRLPAFVRSVNALCKPNVAVSDPEWVSNEFEEYLDGQRVHTDLESKKKFIDESDESDEEVTIVNYENFLTK